MTPLNLSQTIEILFVGEHGVQVRLPNGAEIGITFYPPSATDERQRIFAVDLKSEKTLRYVDEQS